MHSDTKTKLYSHSYLCILVLLEYNTSDILAMNFEKVMPLSVTKRRRRKNIIIIVKIIEKQKEGNLDFVDILINLA